MAGGRLIICNTSPLINFAEIDSMDLLTALAGTVCLVPAVVAEAKAKAELFPKAAAAVEFSEVHRISPQNTLLVRGFAATLHQGESECLALAMERPSSLLILDDLSARAAAAANGLAFTGTLGILAAAKADGRLDLIAPILHALKSQARFWISPQLEHLLLKEAGELA